MGLLSNQFGQQCRYQRLDERQKKPSRRLKGFRIPRSKKLSSKQFSLYVLSSRITRMYGEIVRRLSNMDGAYPSIVFSTQWGLPVLSHSSRKATMAIDRSLACF